MGGFCSVCFVGYLDWITVCLHLFAYPDLKCGVDKILCLCGRLIVAVWPHQVARQHGLSRGWQQTAGQAVSV